MLIYVARTLQKCRRVRVGSSKNSVFLNGPTRMWKHFWRVRATYMLIIPHSTLFPVIANSRPRALHRCPRIFFRHCTHAPLTRYADHSPPILFFLLLPTHVPEFSTAARENFCLPLHRLERFHFMRRDGMAIVLGTITSVGGATIITLYKGPPLLSGSNSFEEEMATSQEDMLNWTWGCVYLHAHCLSWAGWMVLQEGLPVTAVSRCLVPVAVRVRQCKDNCSAIVIAFRKKQ